MDNITLDLLKRLAKGVAAQFGEACEVLVHDLSSSEHTVAHIENGSVTHRQEGDGPSRVVLQALNSDPKELDDHLNYLTRTDDGRILRSSTIFVRDGDGRITGVFSMNYDMTNLMLAENTIRQLVTVPEQSDEIEHIPSSVNELLDDLIERSCAISGKPVAMMTKDDKIRAIHFLSDSGAFLITKSSEKVSKYFGISKFTLYNYIEAGAKAEEEEK